MDPSIEAVGASIEVVKASMDSTETSSLCNSFLHWLPPTSVDFRLLPQSLHMLASATMSFRPYRRGGGGGA